MIWKNCGAIFTYIFGGVAGGIPRRGGSGKAVGFEAWGRLPPLYIFCNELCLISLIFL
jgi:hypothetical protein